ncbi:MAG TPA: NERD domain-containing protein [Firmicutes bacterium]|nr:NERD domain-containing protein [Bacillota bacterium]
MLMLLFLIAVLTAFLTHLIHKHNYEKTQYFKQTQNSYWNVRKSKGLLGEYYTYTYLEHLPGYKRFVFNCYLPKQNEERTEVDIILIHESGVYVLESKNYSGWIFGTETNQYWTQVLPTGKGHSKKHNF